MIAECFILINNILIVAAVSRRDGNLFISLLLKNSTAQMQMDKLVVGNRHSLIQCIICHCHHSFHEKLVFFFKKKKKEGKKLGGQSRKGGSRQAKTSSKLGRSWRGGWGRVEEGREAGYLGNSLCAEMRQCNELPGFDTVFPISLMLPAVDILPACHPPSFFLCLRLCLCSSLSDMTVPAGCWQTHSQRI